MISKLAVVETENIGENVTIGEFCVIRKDVIIGDNVVIHPHVIINDGSEIGDNVEIFSGTVLGKEPKGAGVLTRPLEYQRKIIIGSQTSIGPNAIIYYDVSIGKKCLIGDAAAIREKCLIDNNCIIGRHVSLLYNVEVGKNTRIMTNSHLTGNTKVGENVFISVGVNSVNDNAFGEAGYDNHIAGQFIENHVKIGPGVNLLPNIRICEYAVVAAGAVVTKDVERYSLVMGVPAKHVRFLEPNK